MLKTTISKPVGSIFLILCFFIYMGCSGGSSGSGDQAQAQAKNPSLTGLSLSSGTLSPAFNENITLYSAEVDHSTSSICVTPTIKGENASVAINRVPVISGTCSQSIDLDFGQNTITVTVLSGNTAIKTYAIVVTRPSGLSNNAYLSNLILSAGSLQPVFSKGHNDYTAEVSNGTSSITLTPTVDGINAEVTVNGTLVPSGTPSAPIALSVGANAITATVTAEDNVTTNTYNITVTRLSGLSNNANLAGLSLSSGTLSPAFDKDTTSYSAGVYNETASITATPTVAGTNATVTVNGIPIPSGTSSPSMALSVGANTITIIVTAENGTSTKTYTVSVTRDTSVLNRSFRAQKVTDNSWYDVPSTRKAVSSHCVVYVENTASVSEAAAAAIAAEFDNNIYDKIRGNFGNESDHDSNGKVILLFLDIIDGFSGSGGYVAGYFHPINQFSKSSYSDSNEAEMLYLDVYPAVVGSQGSYSTIAHELQHLVNFVNTYEAHGFEEEIWINEGLSSGAEYVYAGAQVQSRIDYYNADPSGTIRYGNNFFVWNGYWENDDPSHDVLADYATVYLFFQWLRIHASNDIGIYKEIIDSGFSNYRAVTTPASGRISSAFGTWSTLLGTWMEANIFNEATGYQGYKNIIDTAALGFTPAGGAGWSFSPGEGIVSQTSGGTYTPPAGSGANIRYIGLNSNGDEDTSSPYTGSIVLVYNSNSSSTGADETGYISNVSSLTQTAPMLNRSIAVSSPIPEIYPIEINFQLGNGGLHPMSHRPHIAKGRPFIKGNVNNKGHR